MATTIITIMASITLRVDVEVRLINAGIERKKWAEYTNNAVLEALKKEGGEKMKR